MLVTAACSSSTPSTTPTRPPPPIDAAVSAPPDAAPAVPLDQDLARLAISAVALYEELAAGLVGAGEDCAAATKTLQVLATKHAAVIAANAKVVRDGRTMELKLALRPYDIKFDAAARTIVGSKVLAACVQDSAFVTAYDALAGTRP